MDYNYVAFCCFVGSWLMLEVGLLAFIIWSIPADEIYSEDYEILAELDDEFPAAAVLSNTERELVRARLAMQGRNSNERTN